MFLHWTMEIGTITADRLKSAIETKSMRLNYFSELIKYSVLTCYSKGSALF